MKRNLITCIIPNLNGINSIGAALDSLLLQCVPDDIEVMVVVVDNASTDESVAFIRSNYPTVQIIEHEKNYGFTGGVNAGIRAALAGHSDYIALLNNDALADPEWLCSLYTHLEKHPKTGIATGKIVTLDGKKLDSTGECYTVWGLSFPRGRGEPDSMAYDLQTNIFGASGGASMYRCSMLKNIGLFDQDFFAYYEDLDISFRARLQGWQVAFVPGAKAYHKIGQTSNRMPKGFTTYQMLKNISWVAWKNVPARYLWGVIARLALTEILFVIAAFGRRQGGVALKGLAASWLKLPKKLVERRQIQKKRTVHPKKLWSMVMDDLPPDAYRLRTLRKRFGFGRRRGMA